MDYDAIVIGSGFGGSVAALRLAEKGYRVAVLEQGRRYTAPELEKANSSIRDLFWMPALGIQGCFTQQFFQHVNVVGGVGVGGGSLVYAAVLLEPKSRFFHDPAWSHLGVDWEAELAPHFQTASRMLGRVICPVRHIQDEWLEATAKRMGVGESYGPVPLGIFFGDAEIDVPDPILGGAGPARRGCRGCGACLAGCAYNAKNSLDKNYLYLAERLGACILPRHKAVLVRPLAAGFLVESVDPTSQNLPQPPLTAHKVVFSAGVLGTLALLFRSRQAGALPELSPMLGRRVRTNSEAITAVLSPSGEIDLSQGPAISSDFHANEYTHITQNRVPPSYWFMKLYASPLVDGSRPWVRALKTLGVSLAHPLQASASLRTAEWHKQITLISTMQNLDNQISFRWGRDLFTGFKPGLRSQAVSSARSPSYIAEANLAARTYAQVSGGIAYNSSIESVLNMSVTAHILGGCPISDSSQTGVINTRHEVFGYPGLYVVDGSALPVNVGVNPSLTITALAERAMAGIH